MMGQPLHNHHGPGWAPAPAEVTVAPVLPHPPLPQLSGLLIRHFSRFPCRAIAPSPLSAVPGLSFKLGLKSFSLISSGIKQVYHRSGQDQAGFGLTAIGSHPEKSPGG